MIRVETIEAYGAACAKVHALTCNGWGSRFQALFSTGSAEQRATLAAFPGLPQSAKNVFGISKHSQSYRAPDFDFAAFDAGFAALLDERNSAAAGLFRKLLEEYPKSTQRIRTKYWMAEALQRDGVPEIAHVIRTEIIKESPLSYYGWLAADSSGRSIESRIEGIYPEAEASDPDLFPLKKSFPARKASVAGSRAAA